MELTRHGLRVPKHGAYALPAESLRALRALLTITPLAPEGGPAAAAAAAPPSFRAYLETSEALFVPRFVKASGLLPAGASSTTAAAAAAALKFAGSMRPAQVAVVEAGLAQCRDLGGGLLVLPTGFGKTVCALYLACALGVRTLVLAHKGFLLDQWAERIQQYAPGARVGRIQQDKVDVKDKDIVLGMLQSISKRDYPEATFDGFGLTIVDEVSHLAWLLLAVTSAADQPACCSPQCHHISAPVFSRAMFKCTSKYMLGLSATPGGWRPSQPERALHSSPVP